MNYRSMNGTGVKTSKELCGVSSLDQIKQIIEAINKPALSEALFNQANEISERLREGRIHYFKD